MILVLLFLEPLSSAHFTTAERRKLGIPSESLFPPKRENNKVVNYLLPVSPPPGQSPRTENLGSWQPAVDSFLTGKETGLMKLLNYISMHKFSLPPLRNSTRAESICPEKFQLTRDAGGTLVHDNSRLALFGPFWGWL